MIVLQLLATIAVLGWTLPVATSIASGKPRDVANGACKCGPTDDCWPSSAQWQSLNSSVSGRLIANQPIAKVCYSGSQQDLKTCAALVTAVTNSTFVANDPIALDYPFDDSCPVVYFSTGAKPGNCTIGNYPVYTIDATNSDDVVAGVNFARKRNLRLIVRLTGHDLLGRSTGGSSLEIWLRHLREGISFQKTYEASNGCKKSSWMGSSFFIGGGYVWADVYTAAVANNVIVVGGGDPTVGCIGGWAQGGGHSPASRDFGLGADQILEARVVLANGAIVTANACENADLFFAIRGGGGGTYGIVISTTVKAHPPISVAAQTFSMAPLTEANIPQFMEALATIYENYPDLNDAGYSGYGSWNVNSYAPVVGNSTTGYRHVIAVFGQTIAEAQRIYAPVAAKLAPYNGTSLSLTASYLSFPSYATYYANLSGVQEPVGASAAIGSRLLDRKALADSPAALRQMLNATAGTPGQFTSTNVALVSGGQVFKDAADPDSGVNPAWRTSYLHSIVAEGWAPGADAAAQKAVYDDITFKKVGAMRALAPDTGGYMNENDRFDPSFLQDFYGQSLAKLEKIKGKYDSSDLFYCPTCVGSERWVSDTDGRLCKVS